jgi:hypothetical protein
MEVRPAARPRRLGSRVCAKTVNDDLCRVLLSLHHSSSGPYDSGYMSCFSEVIRTSLGCVAPYET